MKRLTNIEQHRRLLEESELMARTLCGYDEATFAALQFESAYQYLEDVLGTDAWGMQEYPKHKAFWNWWRIQWHSIDLVLFGCPDKGIRGRMSFDLDRKIWYCSRPTDPTREYYIRDCKAMQHFYELYHKVGVENRYINSATTEAAFHIMQKSLINQ